MGFGLPASIGVQLAAPDKTVISVSGDGSLQMNLQELVTIRGNNLPIKIFLFNNSSLGMVRQWQEMFFDNRISCSEFKDNPDFVKLAKSFGLKAQRVEKFEEVRPAIRKALNTEGPYLIDFKISCKDKVFPIVPPGSAIDQMILGTN